MSYSAFIFLILSGTASLLIAVFVTPWITRGRHVLMALVAGALCLVPSYMFGIHEFCLVVPSGELCGLAALLGTAPLGFAIGTLMCAVLIRLLDRDRRGSEPH